MPRTFVLGGLVAALAYAPLVHAQSSEDDDARVATTDDAIHGERALAASEPASARPGEPLESARLLGDPAAAPVLAGRSAAAPDWAVVGIVIASTGAGLVAGSAVFFGLMANEESVLDANCDATTCPASFDQQSVVTRFEVFRGFAWPLLFTGILAVGLGAGLGIASNREDEAPPPPTVACSADGCVLAWGARW